MPALLLLPHNFGPRFTSGESADVEISLTHVNVFSIIANQHFYPDGGWGWIICGVTFLAHILTTGFQLSYGLLSFYAIQHLGENVATETGKYFA